MNAKEFLEQIEMRQKIIINKLAEVKRWREIATSATSNMSGEKVESTHNPQKTMDVICTYMDLEKEIQSDIEEHKGKIKDVLNVIEQLKPMEYDLLHKVYVQFFTLKEAAYKCDISYTNARNIHGSALKHVQIILNEREKK